MDFLGVGPLELIFVMIIAILIIGPKDIGKTAKTIGRFLNRVYKSDEWRTLTEASRSLRTLPNRLAREAELEGLNEITKTIKDTTEDLTKSRDHLIKETKSNIASLTHNPPEEADAMKAWTMPPREGKAKEAGAGNSLVEGDKPGTEES
jgi:Sec-independent protein translocase protein TatA